MLNVSANCIDRHLATRGDQVAIIWEGDDPTQSETITYRQLHERDCTVRQCAEGSRRQEGDRVTIYLPMIPEAAYAMLACARIGAIHSVVFGGFSPESLASRIEDAKVAFIITADEGMRGGKTVPLKKNIDEALGKVAKGDEKVLVVRRTGGVVPWAPDRDMWLHDEIAKVGADCPPVEMNAEDPLFILYTSGSTGTPKGVVHTTGGYLIYASMTHQYVFDYHAGDIYWCTADVGWVTGHSYIVYGPLANGATTLMFEGVPSYPTASRFWDVVDKWHVNILYTAPTAIRALMGAGDGVRKGNGPLLITAARQRRRADQSRGLAVVSRCDRRGALPDRRHLVADGNRRHHDHAAARSDEIKAGIGDAAVFRRRAGARRRRRRRSSKDRRRATLSFSTAGRDRRAPYTATTSVSSQVYFSTYPGMYFTGDGCRRDEDGYYWITGRVDDVINVSGHRLGTAEIESALVAHPKVSEAAVVGYPHNIKGQGIYCYVTLNAGEAPSESLKKELVAWCARRSGRSHPRT